MRLRLKVDKWDSYFFNARIGRIEVNRGLAAVRFRQWLSALLEQAAAQRFEYIVIKVGHPAFVHRSALLKEGFVEKGTTVDSVYRYAGTRIPQSANAGNVRFIKRGEIRRVQQIVFDAFRLSYLYACGFGKKSEVDRYHKVWVKNISQQKNARIFVAMRAGKIAGFLALTVHNQEYARIVLVAVHKRYRGRGVGSELLQGCLVWARAYVKKVYVRTQGNNKKAWALYKKFGFRTIQRQKIFCRKMVLHNNGKYAQS